MNIISLKPLLRIVAALVSAILLLLSVACQPTTETTGGAPESDSAPEIQVTPLSAELAVKVDVANLRSGPGLDFDSVGSLQSEERIAVDGISADGGWYRLADGSWIAAEFVEEAAEAPEEPTEQPPPTNAPTQPPTATETETALAADTPTDTPTSVAVFTPTVGPTSTPPDTTANCRTTSDVFLLSGPGSSNAYYIITSLPARQDMLILGGNRQDGNHTHYKVRAAGGAEGWVIADSCPVEGDPPIEAVSFPPPFTPTFTVTPSPTPSNTPTPSSTPLAPDTVTPGATNSPTPLPPDTLTPTATLAGTPTPLPPDTPTPIPTISETAVPGG